ncbi:MAG: hypothetical protein JWM02_1174 [Frankiales bacterium]|nr:hypothetical protein [Frankiales bacterium]
MLRLLVSPRWLVRHVLLVLAVATCIGFGRWQYHRAVDRNSILNWSYTIEWTLFGLFAVLCWAWFLRDELRGPPEEDEQAPPPRVYQPVAQPVSDEEDPELAAYNRYLAELNERSR